MINLQIPHATTVSALRARIKSWREDGLTVGFVPTMGSLHDGHLSLVRLAKAQSDRVVASIFVNPAQFAEGEDFDTYPRDMLSDAEKLATAQCDLIYLPEREAMYPGGFASKIEMTGPALGLESESRPHFFSGVATVVAKLFNQVRPDVAVFGEKDYQQLLVIRQLVRDLDFPIDIIAGETGRDRDGLALSSRNAYLSEADRKRAAALPKILKALADALSAGGDVQTALATARDTAEAAFDGVDYITVRKAADLAETEPGPLRETGRILAAIRLGDTRLIDNLAALPFKGPNPG
ncbi:pantoate--beta-alanine ligase [Maricaulis sp.]|uniref:pantoate--beta-alanine ligase n=1 Tax=Maricaulis sp. TaxID=1486257 RepID=UPI00263632CC|nr:pantoate--beta-alanine ligase [Maricaulis sp.]